MLTILYAPAVMESVPKVPERGGMLMVGGDLAHMKILLFVYMLTFFPFFFVKKMKMVDLFIQWFLALSKYTAHLVLLMNPEQQRRVI